MSDKPRNLTGKQKDFCKFYRDSANELTYNKGRESARAAGYKGNDNTLAVVATENLNKPNVIAEIARINSETAELMQITRAGQHKKLAEAFKVAKDNNQASAMVSAIREDNEMCGYHREKALNPEKEAEKAARMTDEERRLAEITAKVRVEQEARKGIIKLKRA